MRQHHHARAGLWILNHRRVIITYFTCAPIRTHPFDVDDDRQDGRMMTVDGGPTTTMTTVLLLLLLWSTMLPSVAGSITRDRFDRGRRRRRRHHRRRPVAPRGSAAMAASLSLRSAAFCGAPRTIRCRCVCAYAFGQLFALLVRFQAGAHRNCGDGFPPSIGVAREQILPINITPRARGMYDGRAHRLRCNATTRNGRTEFRFVFA